MIVTFTFNSFYLHAAQTASAVCHEQFFDDVTRCPVHVPGETELTAQNLLVNPEWIIVEKRGVSRQHFVQ